MSSNAILPEQYSIAKPITAKVHGFIDYGHAAFFLTSALVLRKKNPRPALACLFTGSFVLVQSLLTDYPLGAKPVIPFHTHGIMDAAFAGSSFAMPEIYGFSETSAASLFRVNGLVDPPWWL